MAKKSMELQIKGFDKQYLNEDSYLMFLLRLGEKINAIDLYRPVDQITIDLLITEKEIKEHISKNLK